MSKGGARNRSGPQKQEGSRTSDRAGFVLTALPPEGYSGEVPEFPLPKLTRWIEYFVEKVKRREVDDGATEFFREREVDVWEEAWSTPQACAWSLEPWRWPTIAEYCRLKAVVEAEPDANASLVAQLHRYRDQIGLTPAGLKENGWKVAESKAPEPAADPTEGATVTSIKDRLNRGSA